MNDINDEKHWDLGGNPIHVGDIIAYPALWGRSAVLKLGLVVSLKSRKNYSGGELQMIPTLGVVTADRSLNWETKLYEWKPQNEGREITLGFVDRCIKIRMTQLPDNVLAVLTQAARELKAKKEKSK